MLEVCTAFGQWMVCWCVFQWWRVKKDQNGLKGPPPAGTICEGVKNVFLYHWGSIIMGAVAIPFSRPMRLVFWLTSELDPDQATGCFHCVMNTCCCCIGSLKE